MAIARPANFGALQVQRLINDPSLIYLRTWLELWEADFSAAIQNNLNLDDDAKVDAFIADLKAAKTKAELIAAINHPALNPSIDSLFGDLQFENIRADAANRWLKTQLEARIDDVTAAISAKDNTDEIQALIDALKIAADKDALRDAMNLLGLEGADPAKVNRLFAQIQVNVILESKTPRPVLKQAVRDNISNVLAALGRQPDKVGVKALLKTLLEADKPALGARMRDFGLIRNVNPDELFAESQFVQIHLKASPALQAQLIARRNQILPRLAAQADIAAVQLLVDDVTDKNVDKAAIAVAMHNLDLDDTDDANVNKLFGELQHARILADPDVIANPALQALLAAPPPQQDQIAAALGDLDTVAEIDDLIDAVIDNTSDKTPLANAMIALGLDPANVDNYFGELQYDRIIADPRVTANPVLLAQLTARKNDVITALGKQTEIIDIDTLVDAVTDAITESDLKSQMQKLGLNNNDDTAVKDLLTENRTRLLAVAETTDYRDKDFLKILSGKAWFSYKKSSSSNRPEDRYDHFLKAAQSELEAFSAGTLNPNINLASKIEDPLHGMILNLSGYKKALSDLKDALNNAPIAVGAPLPDADYVDFVNRLANSPSKKQEQIDIIDKLIHRFDDYTQRATDIIGEIANINAARLAAGGVTEVGHGKHAATYTGTDYNAAVAEKDKLLGTSAASNNPHVVIAAAALHPSSPKTDTIITIPIDIGSAKSATIRRHDLVKQSAKAEIYFSKEAIRALEKESRHRRGIDFTAPSIPGKKARDWAFDNMKALSPAIQKKNKPIEIKRNADTPDVAIEQLIIYCKFKGYDYTPPSDYKDKVSAHQVALFEEVWKKEHPEDLGKVQEQVLAAQVSRQSLKP